MQTKIAIILQADTSSHEGMARAFHSLLYAKELKENNLKVKLIFDGAGTKWIEEFLKNDNPMNKIFLEVKDSVICEACDYCVDAFKANREKISESKITFGSEYQRHPSLLKLIKEDYQIIIL